VLNNPDLRQLKQRVALRCEIKALPNVEETAQYINTRLKVAVAVRPDIFSPGAVDYIFRCSEGIPRNINNLCDNALLNGFAAGEPIITRAGIQEVAETFDVLPRVQTTEEREAPARIFGAAGRAELWAAGNGNGNGNGSAHKSANALPEDRGSSAGDFPSTFKTSEPDILVNEYTPRSESPMTIEDLGTAFSRSGLGRGNNGQSL
jgi:hypothetical protein